MGFKFHLLTQLNNKSNLFLALVIGKTATDFSSVRNALLGL